MRGCAQRERPQVGADVQQRGSRAPSRAGRRGHSVQAPQDLCTQAELPGSGVDDAAADYVALTAGSCLSERDSSSVSRTSCSLPAGLQLPGYPGYVPLVCLPLGGARCRWPQR